MEAQKLKSTLQRYVEVNKLIFQSDRKLKDILQLANNAIISEGLILNNSLRGYLDILMSEETLNKTSKGEIIKALVEILDMSRDIVTLVKLEVKEEFAAEIQKKELVKYIEKVKRRILSQIDFLTVLINVHLDDNFQTRQSGQA